jgi:hypothetical protein
LFESIEDGLNRKPDWKSLIRVKKWLSEPWSILIVEAYFTDQPC